MPAEAPVLDALRGLFAAHGLATPLAFAELTGGSNASFRIDLTDGSSVVLKTYDVPVSQFQDMPHAPGLYRQMGALLRRLHTVRLPGFGHFSETGIHAPVATNAEYMQRVVTPGFGRFRQFGAEAALADRLEAIVAERAGLFDAGNGAVFTHDDLHPNNVLAAPAADGGYRLSGLIDFGNARAADAVFDLAKTLFMGNHDAPGSVSFIREGYGPIDHPDPEAALWLYTLVHRVTMWSWLRHVGAITAEDGLDLIPALREMAEQA